MVAFCIRFSMRPEDYQKLSFGEVRAFWRMIEPQTDLTGLDIYG